MGKKISRLIGILIIIFILSRLNLAEIKEIFLGSNKYYLVLGFALTIIVAFIKSLRWNYLKRAQKIKYPISDSFAMYCAGALAGIITPGRLGELSKIFYLKNDGCSYGKSALSVIVDRLFDVFFLVIFATVGMFFFFSLFEKEIPYMIGLTVLVLIFSYLFIKTNLLKKTFLKIFNFLIPIRYQESWQINLRDFMTDLKNLSSKNYLFVLGITIFSWLIYYLQMLIFAKSMNINIPFLYLAISVTIAGIVTMIPISYAGIGTRDLVLITLFSFFLISQESAVAFSSVILSTHIIMAILGFIYWLKNPVPLSKN